MEATCSIGSQPIPFKPDDKQKKCHHLKYRDLNRKERRGKYFKKINAVGICLDCNLIFVSPIELVFGDKDGK